MKEAQLKLIARPGVRMSLLAGSATVIGGFLFLLYRNHMRGSNPDFDLPRDTLILILRDFRKEFYTLCKQISVYAEAQTAQLRRRGVPPSEWKSILKNHFESPESGVPDLIHDIENKVYLKYDITNGKEFQRFYDTLAKADPEVRQYKQEMREMYEKAVVGQLATPNVDLPSHITPDIVIAAYRKYFRVYLQKFGDHHLEFRATHGNQPSNHPAYMAGISRLQLDIEANKIASEFGIDFRDEYYPHELLRIVRQKLEKTNSDFARKMNELETFKNAYVTRVHEGVDRETLAEELKNIEAIGLPKPEFPEPLVPPPLAPVDQPKEFEDHNEVLPSPTPAEEASPSSHHDIALSRQQVLEEVPILDTQKSKAISDDEVET